MPAKGKGKNKASDDVAAVAASAGATTTRSKKQKGADGESIAAATAKPATEKKGEWKSIAATHVSVNTVNPIRAIIDKIVVPPQPADKPLIPLSIGDPTFFGNLPVHTAVEDAVVNAIRSQKWNGYGPAHGLPMARAALAARYSPSSGNFKYSADDVIIASGCSGALAIAMTAVADRGDTILIPKPAFSLYQTVCGHYGIGFKEYNLLPEQSWEADLKHMESLIDTTTRAILLNNPANPTGSNYSKAHLTDILKLAQRFQLVIIADEIYANIVFHGAEFHAIAGLTSAELDVPILTCGGFAKQYLAPGWRMGWCLIHDFPHNYPKSATASATATATATASASAPASAVVPAGCRPAVLGAVREGANRLSQLLLGATTVLQAALPEIFAKLPADFYKSLNATLEAQAEHFVSGVRDCIGLKPVTPQGAMYVMIGIDTTAFTDIKDDREFAQKLLNEEFVYVLPGACFSAPNFFRVVFCAPKEKIASACERIRAFCKRHATAAALAAATNGHKK